MSRVLGTRHVKGFLTIRLTGVLLQAKFHNTRRRTEIASVRRLSTLNQVSTSLLIQLGLEPVIVRHQKCQRPHWTHPSSLPRVQRPQINNLPSSSLSTSPHLTSKSSRRHIVLFGRIVPRSQNVSSLMSSRIPRSRDASDLLRFGTRVVSGLRRRVDNSEVKDGWETKWLMELDRSKWRSRTMDLYGKIRSHCGRRTFKSNTSKEKERDVRGVTSIWLVGNGWRRMRWLPEAKLKSNYR